MKSEKEIRRHKFAVWKDRKELLRRQDGMLGPHAPGAVPADHYKRISRLDDTIRTLEWVLENE